MNNRYRIEQICTGIPTYIQNESTLTVFLSVEDTDPSGSRSELITLIRIRPLIFTKSCKKKINKNSKLLIVKHYCASFFSPHLSLQKTWIWIRICSRYGSELFQFGSVTLVLLLEHHEYTHSTGHKRTFS